MASLAFAGVAFFSAVFDVKFRSLSAVLGMQQRFPTGIIVDCRDANFSGCFEGFCGVSISNEATELFKLWRSCQERFVRGVVFSRRESQSPLLEGQSPKQRTETRQTEEIHRLDLVDFSVGEQEMPRISSASR